MTAPASPASSGAAAAAHCRPLQPNFRTHSSHCEPRSTPPASRLRTLRCAATRQGSQFHSYCCSSSSSSWIVRKKVTFDKQNPSPYETKLRLSSPPSSTSPRRSTRRNSAAEAVAMAAGAPPVVAAPVGIALLLTCVGSASTALGGLLVVVQKVPDIKRLGVLQGFAAGLMLSLSFFDLMPNAITAIGFTAANVWFFSGALMFAVIVAFIPEPSLLPTDTDAEIDELKKLNPAPSDEPAVPRSPDASSSVSSAANLIHRGSSREKTGGGAAAAGIVVGGAGGVGGSSDVLIDGGPRSPGRRTGGPVVPVAAADVGPAAAPAGSAAAAAAAAGRKRRQAVLFSGIITAVGISVHNFPEGIAVFLGSMKGLSVGISLAVAIALHNIPEGLAVSLPIYYATRSRWTAFRAAALSGLAEPLAVVVVAVLFPANLSPHLIEGMLAGVGGIMAFLTLHEMLPLAFEYAGHRKAVAATFIGMAVMSANLRLLEAVVPADVAL